MVVALQAVYIKLKLEFLRGGGGGVTLVHCQNLKEKRYTKNLNLSKLFSIQNPEKIHGCTELTTPNSRVNNSVFTRNETCRPKSYLDCQPSISSSGVTGNFSFSRNTLFISFFLIIMSQIVLSRSYWCTIAFLFTPTI